MPTPAEATEALGKLLQMVDDGPILNFSELARLVFDMGTDAEKDVIQRRTGFLESYIQGKKDRSDDRRYKEERRVRNAFHEKELHDIAGMDSQKLRKRLDDFLSAMSKQELETALGLLAGERGWTRRQEVIRERKQLKEAQ